MIPDLPVERVNGQEEWSWNEQQTVGATPDVPEDTADRRPGDDSGADTRECQVTARRRVKQLESELERKEQEQQRVIERYERLLAKKDQQLAERSEPDTEREGRATIRTVLARYVDSRW